MATACSGGPSRDAASAPAGGPAQSLERAEKLVIDCAAAMRIIRLARGSTPRPPSSAEDAAFRDDQGRQHDRRVQRRRWRARPPPRLSQTLPGGGGRVAPLL